MNTENKLPEPAFRDDSENSLDLQQRRQKADDRAGNYAKLSSGNRYSSSYFEFSRLESKKLEAVVLLYSVAICIIYNLSS